MSANPHANGGKLRKPLDMPDFRTMKFPSTAGNEGASPTENLGKFLRDVMRRNMTSFRVFSPDENASNRLQDVYEASLKTWMAEIKPEDADGTDIAPDGRVMEMLSEHTLEGWLEGYLLTGRHGFFNTYEAFATSSIPCTTSTQSGWRSRSWNSLASPDLVAQPADLVAGLAPGSQRLHARRSRLPRRGQQQERESRASIFLPMRTACSAWRTTACAASTT
jgi:phosphoketolase